MSVPRKINVITTLADGSVTTQTNVSPCKKGKLTDNLTRAEIERIIEARRKNG